MFKTSRLFVLFLITSSLLNDLHAQTSSKSQSSSKPKTSSRQNIIIQKKDSTKEKITVVIDGNNVTINGKPVDDFVSNDVNVIQQKIKDGDFYVYSDGPVPPIAPLPPQARVFKKDMMYNIHSNTAFLGVMTEQNDLGAKITDVTDSSSAEKAGLKEDDIITKIGDDKITGPDDLYKVVGKHKPEEKVVITYLRNGKTAIANATLGKSEQMRVYSWNTPEGDVLRKNYQPYNFSYSWSDKPRLGISAQDTEDGSGVKVLDIDDEDSPAAKAGLKEDDIITQVNGKAITSTEDLRESVKDIKKGDTVKITYKRNNQTQTIDVKLPKDLKTIDL